MLDNIRKITRKKPEGTTLLLHKIFVFPHLEHHVQFWPKQLEKDGVDVKRVQIRTTEMITGMNQLPYKN